jgi:hypothetical protein
MHQVADQEDRAMSSIASSVCSDLFDRRSGKIRFASVFEIG